MRQQHHVVTLAAASWPTSPGEIAALANPEHTAQAMGGKLRFRPIDEREPHRLPSRTKKAVAFFRMSRSCRRISFPRRSRFSSAVTSLATPDGSTACRSRLRPIQRTSVDRPIPRSPAISRCVRPLVCTRRTASSANSFVNRRCCVIEFLIAHGNSPLFRSKSSYDVLRTIKPEIVYVSMSGYGHTGRHHHYTTFGPVAQAVSGLTYQSGLPDKPPAGWGWSYMDDTGGLYGAMCALAGLYHRNRTGQGQHIDLSQMVASVTLNGPALLDVTVNGRGSTRAGFPPGNRAHWPGTPLLNNYRGPTVAPHNAYRTDPGGYNDWCVIVCQSDAEWQRLVEVIGCPSWAMSPKFASVTGRLQHQEELDSGIEAWTLTLGKYEVTER